MKTQIVISAVVLSVVVFSCSKNSKNEAPTVEAASDAISKEEMSSSAATQQDEKRKFVKTADAQFETKDVYKTTLAIEQNVTQ